MNPEQLSSTPSSLSKDLNNFIFPSMKPASNLLLDPLKSLPFLPPNVQQNTLALLTKSYEASKMIASNPLLSALYQNTLLNYVPPFQGTSLIKDDTFSSFNSNSSIASLATPPGLPLKMEKEDPIHASPSKQVLSSSIKKESNVNENSNEASLNKVLFGTESYNTISGVKEINIKRESQEEHIPVKHEEIVVKENKKTKLEETEKHIPSGYSKQNKRVKHEETDNTTNLSSKYQKKKGI